MSLINMQLHRLFANINIRPYLHSILCPALILFSFTPLSFSYSLLTHQTAIVCCTLVPTRHRLKCCEWEWQKSWHKAPLWGRNFWQGLECIRATAELLTAPTKSPKSNCQSPQIAWYISKIPVQVLEAEEPTTMKSKGSFSLESITQTPTRWL